MKSIALTKLSLALPPQLRDLVMDPAARAAAPCCRLLPAAHRRVQRLAIDHLVQALTGLVAGLALPELLCLVDGNQDESSARPWLAGLPARHDRTRALLGLLLKELKEPQTFDGLIRLHEPDFARWLPALARRALKSSRRSPGGHSGGVGGVSLAALRGCSRGAGGDAPIHQERLTGDVGARIRR